MRKNKTKQKIPKPKTNFKLCHQIMFFQNLAMSFAVAVFLGNHNNSFVSENLRKLVGFFSHVVNGSLLAEGLHGLVAVFHADFHYYVVISLPSCRSSVIFFLKHRLTLKVTQVIIKQNTVGCTCCRVDTLLKAVHREPLC